MAMKQSIKKWRNLSGKQLLWGEKMKNIIALTICFMFVGVGSIFAGSLQKLKHNTWESGVEISHIKYEEPSVNMQEQGIMWGVCGSFTHRNNWMLKAEGNFSVGQVDYSSPSGTSTINDYKLEVRGLAGYGFPLSQAILLTPYIGFGYRYLNDDLTSGTLAGAYERESNYYYSPIGVETITELGSGRSLGVTIEYDYFWKGIQKSHLSDINSGLSDLQNDQNGGYGLRGSIKFQDNRLVIEPFIRYWDIDKSDVQEITYKGNYAGSGLEPKNNSTEIGIKIAIKW